MKAERFLADAGSSANRVRRRFQKVDSPTEWIYLGRNQLRLREWERNLGDGFKRIAFAEKFQALALELRAPFLNWIADLSRKHASLTWWSSRLAEKNVLLDTIHHTICYFEIARDYLNRSPRLLIVVESPALLRELKDWLAKENVEFGVQAKSRFLAEARWFSLFVLKWAWFWGDAVLATWDAWWTRRGRATLPARDGRKVILLHSFLDDSFFAKGQDRYFNELPEQLSRQGHQVLILPRLFNVTRSRRDAFAWFRERAGKFLIPEDFYRFSDYFWSMRILMRQLWTPRGPYVFQGRDVSRLVKEVQRRGSVMIRSANYIRYYRLVKRLSEQNFKVDVFVDTFENMFNEKPSVIGFREFMPETLTVGYQHWASPGPLNYCNFTTPEEAAFAPHPDRIVCCSPFTARIFAQEGFPPEKLFVGPSLRYPHLLQGIQRQKSIEKNVLALFCLEENAILHLLHTLLDAFAGCESEFTLWLKPHPLMDPAKWDRMFEGRTPLKNMVRIGGTMGEWIPSTSCAIIGTSSTSMELAIAGVPTVQLGRENDFDLNVLHWFPEFSPPVYTATALRNRVREMLRYDEIELTRLTNLGKAMAVDCVSPVNDETLGSFWRGSA